MSDQTFRAFSWYEVSGPDDNVAIRIDQVSAIQGSKGGTVIHTSDGKIWNLPNMKFAEAYRIISEGLEELHMRKQ